MNNKMSFKKGDYVLVISGDDKGKKGKIVSIFPKKMQVIVESVNFLKKHTKPTQNVPQGGVIKQEGALHISNIKLICNKCNKPTTVKREKIKEGKRVRVCKKCKEIIDKV
ncbi:MAG: 50S ribosomal protein L24 [Candidatus Infernicultor aquiphilus]|uniref:Large ribosomal subunit protein uL24 n=1 Tax=Candidatus Infernicultor aquiphilus TaxID=1805029 RepID=A0A2M8CA02_9BACT|nr:MAG: 50S ribosomal protein L24 [Candidatus Atribacteria bacterium CG08_land_8_20_14_0_20_33_29]PIW11992.1 MAG: 50S ribosomal protein L24 [Candidatus Atribacteria bacterium CG17_big_fil_post_rev_8_21_14_2_50_34_11]PIX33430.1 MAG: 50S ribosomal protein L24 [Candidatus Atribacteria bacterium CG_4_8_14_3_um_filter_34_18]PIY32397.1 MAG: 50S ribosomal protein L24 [Candidatus Atribacteria bacterium CG_4_10_14_3_um_filter_34_13]PJB55887.1 MAG: 50S ribosomal protein L24 [Candidatus Atribacteria bacte